MYYYTRFFKKALSFLQEVGSRSFQSIHAAVFSLSSGSSHFSATAALKVSNVLSPFSSAKARRTSAGSTVRTVPDSGSSSLISPTSASETKFRSRALRTARENARFAATVSRYGRTRSSVLWAVAFATSSVCSPRSFSKFGIQEIEHFMTTYPLSSFGVEYSTASYPRSSAKYLRPASERSLSASATSAIFVGTFSPRFSKL